MKKYIISYRGQGGEFKGYLSSGADYIFCLVKNPLEALTFTHREAIIAVNLCANLRNLGPAFCTYIPTIEEVEE